MTSNSPSQIRVLKRNDSLIPVPEGDEVYVLELIRRPIDPCSPLSNPGYHINEEGLGGLSGEAREQLTMIAMERSLIEKVGYGGLYASKVEVILDKSGVTVKATR